MLLAIGVGVYSRTDHFRRLLREQALVVLQDTVNAEVSLGEIRGSLWTAVEVRDLALRQDGVDVLTAPRGTITLRLLPQLVSLFRSATLGIPEVTLSEPVVHVVEDPETGWNVAHLLKETEEPEEPEEPLPISLRFPHLELDRGQIFVHLADGKEWRLSNVSINGELTIPPTGLRAEVAEVGFSLTGPDIPAVQWKGQLSYVDENGQSRVTVRSLDVRTDHSHLHLAGTLDNLADPTIALTLDVKNLAAVDVATVVPSPRFQQDLTGQMQLSGPLSALQIHAALTAPSGKVTSLVTANLSQTPPDAEGTVQIEHLVLEKVAPLTGFAGEVSGQMQFQGTTLETLRADVAAYAGGLVAAEKRIGDVNVTADIKDKRIASFVEIKSNAGYAFAQSRVSLEDPLAYEATVMVRNLNANRVTEESKTPATNLNVDVWVKGKGTQPEAMDSQLKLAVLPSQVETTRISQGEFVAVLRNGQLTLDKGILLADDAMIDVQGQLGALRTTAAGQITYNVLAKNLTPWLGLAGVEGKGGLNLSGTAAGSLKALRAVGQLSLEQVSVNANSVRTGRVSYEFTELGGAQPQGRVTASLNGVRAGMPLKSVNAEATFAGLQPADVRMDVMVQDESSRTHRLTTRARYAPDQLEVLIQELSLQLPSGTWRAPREPRLVLRGETLTIEDLMVQRAEQSVSIDGTMGRKGPLQLQARVNRFALEELRPLLGDGPELKGRLNANITARGTVTNPEVAADLSTGALSIAGQSYTGLSAQSAYQSGQLTLALLFKQDETHTLTVDGSAPVTLPGNDGGSGVGEANLRIRSDGLSLAFVEAFSKEISRVRGTVTTDLTLQGPLAALTPSGSLRLHEGQVRVKALDQTFSDITMDMLVEPSVVRLSRLFIKGGKGQLTASGKVGLSGYTPGDIDLTFDAEQFRVLSTKEYRAALSGKVECTGSVQAPVVKGAVRVVDVEARPDLALMKSGPAPRDETIVVAQNLADLKRIEEEAMAAQREEQTEQARSAAQDGVFHKLALNLAMTIPRDTWVRMSEGSIELMGNLLLQKEPEQEMALVGAIETVRGWFAVQGRQFRLEKGAIVFTGATPIDPTLDVVARYNLPQYQYVVDVVVGGTVKQPTVEFRSDPELEQADILSLLAFGRPANALSDKEKNTLQAQALQTVAGSVAADLRGAIAGTLGVDNLELEMGQTPGEGKVGIGKYIAPGVYVSTSQQLGDNSHGRDVSIEYQLSENWQLKASSTARGDNGVDILWKKKY
jgi:autotransporter translocation and assembly factor TamB